MWATMLCRAVNSRISCQRFTFSQVPDIRDSHESS
jgi:hypothetical protein